MIVVAIIGILAAIGIPIYTNYVHRAKQVEAKTLLLTLKVEEEQFRAENNCYALVVANDLPETNRLDANNSYYDVAVLQGADTATCPNGSDLANDFQTVVTGNLAGGVDYWGISDRIPAPVHCDGRPSYTADQTAACAGYTAIVIEY